MTDRERGPDSTGVNAPETTPGPDRKPTGQLGGHPVNAHETAPKAAVPDPKSEDPAATKRHPHAVDAEPGSDL